MPGFYFAFGGAIGWFIIAPFFEIEALLLKIIALIVSGVILESIVRVYSTSKSNEKIVTTAVVSLAGFMANAYGLKLLGYPPFVAVIACGGFGRAGWRYAEDKGLDKHVGCYLGVWLYLIGFIILWFIARKSKKSYKQEGK